MAFLPRECPKLKDVLDYWPELIEGMRFSTKEFYDRLEAALRARNIPELQVRRVHILEGGLMTPRREYLRLRRERLIFDISAMPFGSGFYVSEWFWEQPRLWGLIVLLALGAIVSLGWVTYTGRLPISVYRYCFNTFGLRGQPGLAIMSIAVPLAAMIVGYVVAVLWFGEALDGVLMRIPVVGFIYERYLRRITYYREDRTQAFQAAVHNAVCSVIDEICEVQGIAPLSDAAKRPMHPQIKPKVSPLRRKPRSDGAGPNAGPMEQIQPVG